MNALDYATSQAVRPSRASARHETRHNSRSDEPEVGEDRECN